MAVSSESDRDQSPALPRDPSLAPLRDPSVDRALTAALRAGAPPSSSCIDAETFAAWADRTLSPEAAEAVESHIADCATCQAMMSAFVRTEPVAAVVIPFWKRSSVRWMVPLVVGTIAATMLIWTMWPRRESLPVPAQTLARIEPMPSPAPPALQPAAPVPSAVPTPSAGSTKPAADRSGIQDQAAKSSASSNRVSTAGQSQAAASAMSGTASAAPAQPQPRPAPAVPPSPPSIPLPPAPAQPVPPAGAASAASAASVAGVLASLPLVTRNALNFVEFLPGVDTAANHNQRDSTVMGLPQSAISITIDGVNTQDQALKSEVAIVAEFSSPAGAIGATGRAGGAAAGGGGGRGGRGGSGIPMALPASPPPQPMRWRVLASGGVERSPVNSTVWEPIAIDLPAVTITGGAAPNAAVCWLIGRGGVVLLAIDGVHFKRVSLPEPVDIASIRATSLRQATVITADGRTFTTTDGGASWHEGPQGFSASPF